MARDDVNPLAGADLPFLDVRSAEYNEDPFTAVDRVRRQDPRGGRLLRTALGVEVVDYDLGRALLSNKNIIPPRADHFREMGAGPLLLQFLTEGKLTALQGEKHLQHRRVLNSPLTPQAVASQNAMYHNIANRLVDGFVVTGRCELIADFSNAYPIEILCRAIGIPVEDIPVFDQVTLEFPLMNYVPLIEVVDRIENALQLLSDYTARLIDDPDRPPQGFVAELAEKRRTGVMTHAEIVWSLVTLLQASHFTTRNQLASIVRALLETGTWDRLVEDPSLIPAAVEEGMRYYPVVLAIPRVVAAPVVIDDVELPEGTFLRFNMMGAGRDPHRFDDADRFDIDRSTSKRIPFGYGAHKCLGHAMARSDMEVALEVLTRRLLNPRIVSPIEPVSTGAMWGPGALYLAFDPA